MGNNIYFKTKNFLVAYDFWSVTLIALAPLIFFSGNPEISDNRYHLLFFILIAITVIQLIGEKKEKEMKIFIYLRNLLFGLIVLSLVWINSIIQPKISWRAKNKNAKNSLAVWNRFLTSITRKIKTITLTSR